MINTRMIEFRDIRDPRQQEFYGHLTPIECGQEIPFDVKRIYYIYGVDHAARRGYHSHRDLEQVLICLGGSVKIQVKTPYEEEIVTLDSPTKGLYIGPMIWREMFAFSEHAALLVLASRHYDESDYLRDYSAYEAEARRYFREAGEHPAVPHI